MTLSRRTLLTALAATPLWSRAALAAYPDRPIRLIVPFAAGGNADLVGRLVAEGMAPSLNGQSVVVENRAGAGGSLGAGQVASAAPDGYTLLVGSNGPLTVNPFVQAKLSYDPLKDFVAVGLANLAPHTLVVHESIPAKTVTELVALSKTQPLTIATSGAGSAGHMTLIRFMAATGANITHVPYRGGNTLVPDMLAGTVSGGMTELSTALPHYKAGKIRIVAVASARRPALAPDVPTMIESGVKDYDVALWFGYVAPAGTPDAIVARLNRDMAAILSDPETAETLRQQGFEPEPGPPETLSARIRSETEMWRGLIAKTGIKPE